ncbi:hypothetical protein HELRODRAFT_165570 [Helobdella robusta]|uniref:Uncharacterized protein n=1 Tax=Helobdella robusta TaxID=6412 RepID=T1EX09_HELRO|nr:hypothetical protein HELRODRAFT_165570 [Helobdella robusta]ESN91523.1 hypothetical protein HELRODRAFT_165570 [Helobdella robusta]
MPNKRKNSAGPTGSNSRRQGSGTRSKISKKGHSRSRSKKKKRTHPKVNEGAPVVPSKHTKFDPHPNNPGNVECFEGKAVDAADASNSEYIDVDDDEDDDSEMINSSSNEQSIQMKISDSACPADETLQDFAQPHMKHGSKAPSRRDSLEVVASDLLQHRKRNAEEANINDDQDTMTPKKQQNLNAQIELLQKSTEKLKISPSPWVYVRNNASERRKHPECYWIPEEWIESIEFMS